MNASLLKTGRLHIGWLTDDHLEEARAIETLAFPGDARGFIYNELQNISAIMVEVERHCCRPLVVGYAVYELFKFKLDLLAMAVHPDWHRLGIGSSLIQYLITRKLHQKRRGRIRADVPDGALAAHLFLQANGFSCGVVIPKGGLSGEDLYRFVYRLPVEQAPACPIVAEASCGGP